MRKLYFVGFVRLYWIVLNGVVVAGDSTDKAAINP